MRFFSEESGAGAFSELPFSTPRPIVGSSEQISLTKGATRVDKRTTSAWQTAAWQMFDAIGEVHYAFELVGQIMSRVRLYVGVVNDPSQPPVRASDYLKELGEAKTPTPQTEAVLSFASDLLDDLSTSSQGGMSNLLRLLTINLCVPGEGYLLKFNGKWMIASTDELTQQGDQLYYKRSRSSSPSMSANGKLGDRLEPNAFVARVWRAHPRWTDEPDSSMLGVLDDCELLVLLQQAMRITARSRMNAGIMFIPEGITSFIAAGDMMSVEESISKASLQSVETESAQATVVPLILKGPPDLGEKIKWIPYGRQIDATFTALVDRTLQRVLQGLDIPKEIVSGLSDTRYSSALLIDDSLFRSHIEPLILMICDAITNVYLRPLLRRQFDSMNLQSDNPRNLVNRAVVWADSSSIVTRPDKSQAANDGYDRKILSAASWRDARGFNDTDEPSEQELLTRVIIEKAQIPPEIADLVLRRIDPLFFKEARAADSTIPPDVESLINPPEANAPPGPKPADQNAAPRPQDQTVPAIEQQFNGGEVTPGGPMPPQPAMR